MDNLLLPLRFFFGDWLLALMFAPCAFAVVTAGLLLPGTKRSLLIYSAVNFTGVLAYAWRIWGMGHLAQIEQRHYYDAGDSFNYLLTAVPVLWLAILFNASWGLKVALKIYRRTELADMVVLALSGTGWTACLLLLRWYAGRCIA